MQKTILAAVFGVLMAGSAFADMSQGDGARMPMADSGPILPPTMIGGVSITHTNPARATPVACDPAKTDRIQAPTCGPVAGTSWQAFPPVSATAKQLDALRKQHVAYRRARYQEVIDNGGCNATPLPVEYAAYCFGPNPAAVGASID
jgi:hypothetical protein